MNEAMMAMYKREKVNPLAAAAMSSTRRQAWGAFSQPLAR